MNKRLVVILSSLLAGFITVGVSAYNFLVPSYNAWKETYDAVMEERANRNYEEIAGVTVKGLNLELINYRPSYVISGTFTEDVDADTLSFGLFTKDDRYNLAEVVTRQIDKSQKTFKMYTDISLAAADGDGNINYTIDETTSSPYGDSEDQHCYFPKLLINGEKHDLANSHLIWDKITLEHNDCVYKIDQTKNGQPRLFKTTDQEIPVNASYACTGAELTQFEDDVCLVLHGISTGYNRETLSKEWSFELRGTVNSANTWAIRGCQGGPVIMEPNETGAFKVYVRLNDVPVTDANPYYSRYNDLALDSQGRLAMIDLRVPGVNGTTDQSKIYFQGKVYTIFLNHGTSAASAYGTVGISIKNA